MTNSNGQPISWLEYRAQKTGKTVEEVRESMRQRGALQDKTKSGFAALPPEQLKAISAAGVKARQSKKDNNEG